MASVVAVLGVVVVLDDVAACAAGPRDERRASVGREHGPHGVLVGGCDHDGTDPRARSTRGRPPASHRRRRARRRLDAQVGHDQPVRRVRGSSMATRRTPRSRRTRPMRPRPCEKPALMTMSSGSEQVPRTRSRYAARAWRSPAPPARRGTRTVRWERRRGRGASIAATPRAGTRRGRAGRAGSRSDSGSPKRPSDGWPGAPGCTRRWWPCPVGPRGIPRRSAARRPPPRPRHRAAAPTAGGSTGAGHRRPGGRSGWPPGCPARAGDGAARRPRARAAAAPGALLVLFRGIGSDLTRGPVWREDAVISTTEARHVPTPLTVDGRADDIGTTPTASTVARPCPSGPGGWLGPVVAVARVGPPAAGSGRDLWVRRDAGPAARSLRR